MADIDKLAATRVDAAADAAVRLLERLGNDIADLDVHSVPISSFVRDTVARLFALLARAFVSHGKRRDWLARLEDAYRHAPAVLAHNMAEHWASACATPEMASAWTEPRLPGVRRALAMRQQGNFDRCWRAPLCFSALYSAGRLEDLVALLSADPMPFWREQVWRALAIAGLGDVEGAARFIDDMGAMNMPVDARAALGERVLLEAGRTEEAYARYAIAATSGMAHVARFESLATRYPAIDKRRILADLIDTTPGEEGRWFATARSLDELDLALELAHKSPVEPDTLVEAARDHVVIYPRFALEAALLVLCGLAEGHGFDRRPDHVFWAWRHAREAAERLGNLAELDGRIDALVAGQSESAQWVRKVLSLCDGAS